MIDKERISTMGTSRYKWSLPPTVLLREKLAGLTSVVVKIKKINLLKEQL